MASVTPNCQHILPTTYNANINYGTTSCISNFSCCRHLSIKNRICSTVYMYMLCVHICVRACGRECLCVYVCMCVCLCVCVCVCLSARAFCPVFPLLQWSTTPSENNITFALT